MKKILLLSLFMTFKAYAIPNKYKTYEKQYIYEFIKTTENKEALIGYISLFKDSALRNKDTKILEFYNLAIYYLTIFDLENTSDKFDQFFISSIESIRMYTKETFVYCQTVGSNSYYKYYESF